MEYIQSNIPGGSPSARFRYLVRVIKTHIEGI